MPPALIIPGYEVGNLEGYWSPRTASIDWCEANYVVSSYIAEFWNTTSNLPAFVFGLYGAVCCVRAGLPAEFAACHISLAVVGVGSALFHGTLLYQSQLLDELPMIYGSCIFIYAILPNAVHDRLGWMVVVLLALFAVVVTAYYTRTWDFDFFTTAYGLQVAVLTVTSIYHCKNPPGRTTADASADVKTKKGDSHTYDKGYKKWESFDVEAELERLEREDTEAEEKKAGVRPVATAAAAITANATDAGAYQQREHVGHQLTVLLYLALSFYFGGFALWNLENNYCGDVKKVRSTLPVQLQPALELHALWHLGTQYGTYVSIILTTFARACEAGLNPTIVWVLGVLPRVDVAATTRSAKKGI